MVGRIPGGLEAKYQFGSPGDYGKPKMMMNRINRPKVIEDNIMNLKDINASVLQWVRIGCVFQG